MRPPIEPLKQNFKENPQRPGTYDIEWIFEGKTDGQIEGHFDRISDRIGIKYFVLKPIRQLRFRHQGAAFGLESWSHGQKDIFTGLIPLPQTDNVLFGNLIGKNRKKSLICLIRDETIIQMLYFESFCPKSTNRQMAFLRAHLLEHFKVVQ